MFTAAERHSRIQDIYPLINNQLAEEQYVMWPSDFWHGKANGNALGNL
jgi:hypothetical protein